MVLSTIAESSRYEQLHPAFARVFEYIKTHDLLNAPLERIVLDGERLYINNVHPELVAQDKQPLEAHQQYLDIHVILEGTERFGWKSLKDCSSPRAPYDADGDYILFDEPATSYVDLKAGEMAIVWPEDAHAPIIGEGKVRKLIVKALVDY